MASVGAGADFFTAAFLTRAPVFAGADFTAALCKRQRFFVAAMILFMPSALIRRLGFGGSGIAGAGGSILPVILAHRAFCARAIFLRDAAVNFLRLRTGASGMTATMPSAAFFAAHRFFSAAMSRFFPSGVILPLRVAGPFAGAGAEAGVSIPSMPRNAASARSMAVFCRSSWLMMPFNPSAIR